MLVKKLILSLFLVLNIACTNSSKNDRCNEQMCLLNALMGGPSLGGICKTDDLMPNFYPNHIMTKAAELTHPPSSEEIAMIFVAKYMDAKTADAANEAECDVSKQLGYPIGQAKDRMKKVLADLQGSVEATEYSKGQAVSFQSLYNHRQEMKSNKTFAAAMCLAKKPECETMSQIGSMSNEQFRIKIKTDHNFWKKIIQLDQTYSTMVGGPEVNPYYLAHMAMLAESNAAFEKRIADTKEEPVENIFIGDSLMGNKFLEAFNPGVLKRTVFMSLTGETTYSLLVRMAYPLALLKSKGLKVKNVVISSSGNDITSGADSVGTLVNIKEMMAMLKDSGVERVYWYAVPPVNFKHPMFLKPVQEHNKKLAFIAASQGVVFLETYTPMSDVSFRLRMKYVWDSIHFNTFGYTQVWIPALLAAGFDETRL